MALTTLDPKTALVLIHAISIRLGAILTALLLARHFGRFHGGHDPGKS